MESIHARLTVSITDLKKNPSGIIKEAEGQAVAILNNNKPMAYLLPKETYEAFLEAMDDLALLRTAEERKNSPSIEVSLDNLQKTRDRQGKK